MIHYNTTKTISTEHQLNVDPQNCFLKSKYDFCNRDIHPYFAQFLEDGTVYTIELDNLSWKWNVKFKMSDIHSMGFGLNVKNWIEKYRGDFEVISREEFFDHYYKVFEFLTFKQKAKCGLNSQSAKQ